MKDCFTFLKSERLVKLSLIALVAVTISPAFSLHAGSSPLPIRGLYLNAPKPEELSLAVRFIRDALPKEGVNVLVMEFD